FEANVRFENAVTPVAVQGDTVGRALLLVHWQSLLVNLLHVIAGQVTIRHREQKGARRDQAKDVVDIGDLHQTRHDKFGLERLAALNMLTKSYDPAMRNSGPDARLHRRCP